MATAIIAPRAEAQYLAIDEWWQRNRPAAPDLFDSEFRAAVAQLEALPEIGRRFQHPVVPGLRRYLLRTSRYHLYYVPHSDVVVILAVWSAVRGSGPDLGSIGT
jgi:plasmid stabilization system protein ParE